MAETGHTPGAARAADHYIQWLNPDEPSEAFAACRAKLASIIDEDTGLPELMEACELVLGNRLRAKDDPGYDDADRLIRSHLEAALTKAKP